MAAKSPYLVVFEDVQNDLRNLTLATRRAWSEPNPMASPEAVLRDIEDRLFALGVAMEMLRGDMGRESADLAAMRVKIAADIEKVAAFAEKVLQRGRELRLRDAGPPLFDESGIRVEPLDGFTLVTRAGPSGLGPNVVAFPGGRK